jgi:hypothetical protein
MEHAVTNVLGKNGVNTGNGLAATTRNNGRKEILSDSSKNLLHI